MMAAPCPVSDNGNTALVKGKPDTTSAASGDCHGLFDVNVSETSAFQRIYDEFAFGGCNGAIRNVLQCAPAASSEMAADRFYSIRAFSNDLFNLCVLAFLPAFLGRDKQTVTWSRVGNVILFTRTIRDPIALYADAANGYL